MSSATDSGETIKREALPPPTFRTALIFGGVTGAFSITVSIWLETSSRSVLLTGLFLDILGAVLLVVPDVPWLNNQFESGRLRSAYETTTHVTVRRFLVAPEIYSQILDDGSNDLPGFLKYVSGAENITDYLGFRETREAFKKWEMRRDEEITIGSDIIAFIPTQWAQPKEFEKQYYDVWIDPEDPHPSMKSEGPHRARQKIELPHIIKVEIDEMEARFRRSGITLLIIGFIFQGLSVIIG